jgi:hypothetical protein
MEGLHTLLGRPIGVELVDVHAGKTPGCVQEKYVSIYN